MKEKVFGVTAVIVRVPLYPAGSTPSTATDCPTLKPWADEVFKVTVVPFPGDRFKVPAVVMLPVVEFAKLKEVAEGTAVTW